MYNFHTNSHHPAGAPGPAHQAREHERGPGSRDDLYIFIHVI